MWRYRADPLASLYVPFIGLIALGLAAGVILSAVNGETSDVVRLVAALAFVSVLARSVLFHRATVLELHLSTLRWRAPARSGAIDVHDVVAIRPARYQPYLEVLECRDGSRIVVQVRRGLRDFIARVVEAGAPSNSEFGSFVAAVERRRRRSHCQWIETTTTS